MENKPKCLRCGKCCQTKTLFKQCSLKERFFYRLILFLTAGFRGFKNPKCKHLRFRHRNSYCAIYDKRPDFCREYFCEKAKSNI